MQKAVARAEAIYAKWGRLAVFFTPTMVSGILKMKYSQFVVWNFVVGAVYVLSVGPAAYGAGKVSAGEQDWRQPGRAGGRAGARRRVRHARGQVLPPPQGPQIAGQRQRQRGQRGTTLTRRLIPPGSSAPAVGPHPARPG